MVLEVAKYLSLNDAINAFSDNILSSLREHNTRVQISDPSKGFLNMILRTMNVEQIVSLHINAFQFYEDIRLSSFSTLTNVISLTLFNPLALNEIIKYALYFDKLSCLSVWYDHKASFDDLTQILHKMHGPIRRFEIHCTGICCPHYLGQSKQVYLQNLTVKYFLFDIGHSLVPFLEHWVTECKPCLLLAIIDFIESTHNIQYVRLITSIYNVDEVLQSNQWKDLMDACSKLKNVTIEMVHSTVFGERLVHKVMEINKPLSHHMINCQISGYFHLVVPFYCIISSVLGYLFFT